MKFSIIIPYFNAEKYIFKCLESIALQTYKDYEVVLINDGSASSSVDALNKTLLSFESLPIRIFNQSNYGVAVARNLGIAKSIGEYLIFLDSDDWLDSSYLEYLYKVLSKDELDCLILDYFEAHDNSYNIVTIPDEFKKIVEKSKFSSLLFLGIIDTNCWNKVYRSNFIKSNKILFPEGIALAEDAVFLFRISVKSPMFRYQNRPFIYYYIDSYGVSNGRFNYTKAQDVMRAISLMEKEIGNDTNKYFSLFSFKQLFPLVLRVDNKYIFNSSLFLKLVELSKLVKFSEFNSFKWKIYLFIFKTNFIHPFVTKFLIKILFLYRNVLKGNNL